MESFHPSTMLPSPATDRRSRTHLHEQSSYGNLMVKPSPVPHHFQDKFPVLYPQNSKHSDATGITPAPSSPTESDSSSTFSRIGLSSSSSSSEAGSSSAIGEFSPASTVSSAEKPRTQSSPPRRELYGLRLCPQLASVSQYTSRKKTDRNVLSLPCPDYREDISEDSFLEYSFREGGLVGKHTGIITTNDSVEAFCHDAPYSSDGSAEASMTDIGDLDSFGSNEQASDDKCSAGSHGSTSEGAMEESTTPAFFSASSGSPSSYHSCDALISGAGDFELKAAQSKIDGNEKSEVLKLDEQCTERLLYNQDKGVVHPFIRGHGSIELSTYLKSNGRASMKNSEQAYRGLDMAHEKQMLQRFLSVHESHIPLTKQKNLYSRRTMLNHEVSQTVDKSFADLLLMQQQQQGNQRKTMMNRKAFVSPVFDRPVPQNDQIGKFVKSSLAIPVPNRRFSDGIPKPTKVSPVERVDEFTRHSPFSPISETQKITELNSREVLINTAKEQWDWRSKSTGAKTSLKAAVKNLESALGGSGSRSVSQPKTRKDHNYHHKSESTSLLDRVFVSPMRTRSKAEKLAHSKIQSHVDSKVVAGSLDPKCVPRSNMKSFPPTAQRHRLSDLEVSCKPMLPVSRSVRAIPVSTTATTSNAGSNLATDMMQAHLQCIVKDGLPCYTMIVDGCDDIMLARAAPLENCSSAEGCMWQYSIRTGKTQSKAGGGSTGGWRSWIKKDCKATSNLTAILHASSSVKPQAVSQNRKEYRDKRLMVTEFVLYDGSRVGEVASSCQSSRFGSSDTNKSSSTVANSNSVSEKLSSNQSSKNGVHRSSVSLGDSDVENVGQVSSNMELAAIVVQVPIDNNYRLFDVDNFAQTSRNSLDNSSKSDDESIIKDRANVRSSKKMSEECVTLLLPIREHGIPDAGEKGPSSLIQRWRTGHCDCGGWDLGCGLKALSTRGASIPGSNMESFKGLSNNQPLMLLSQGRKQELMLCLSLIKHGFLKLSFHIQLSPVTAFATAVAILHSQWLSSLKVSTPLLTSSAEAWIRDRAPNNNARLSYPLKSQQQQQQHDNAVCRDSSSSLPDFYKKNPNNGNTNCVFERV